jgi:hypothetical protein
MAKHTIIQTISKKQLMRSNKIRSCQDFQVFVVYFLRYFKEMDEDMVEQENSDKPVIPSINV